MIPRPHARAATYDARVKVRWIPTRRTCADNGTLSVLVPITVAWTLALHRMSLCHAESPSRFLAGTADFETGGVQVIAWAIAVASFVTLRQLRCVGTGPKPALALAAYGIAGLQATGLAIQLLDFAAIPRGAPRAGSYRSLLHLVDTTSSLAFGLGMGLACVVGAVDFVRIRRGHGWAVDDA